MPLFVPFAVLVHTICSAQPFELILIGTAGIKNDPLGGVHGHIVHVTEFQFSDRALAFWTELLMPVQHVNPMATLTVVHVHHEKFPFSHNFVSLPFVCCTYIVSAAENKVKHI